MADVTLRINISNIEEAKKKAADLVEVLEHAKDLIAQLNETSFIILEKLEDQDQV